MMTPPRFFSTRVAALFVFSCSLHAQTLFQAGGNFTVGLPQNEFKQNVESTGFGGSGYVAYNIPQSFLSLGASFTFLVYGSETRQEPWSQTIPDVFVDVTTTNAIIMGHFLIRVQPRTGNALPYLDGLFGFNYLTTDTQIKDQGDYEEIASSKNLDDITFGYGIGGGVMIRIWNTSEEKTQRIKLQTVFIDLGLRYLKGGSAEYLKEGSIEISNGNVNYDIKKSTTDILTIHVGASFAF